MRAPHRRARRLAALVLAALAAAAAVAGEEPRTQIELAPEVAGLDELVDLALEVTVDGFQGVAVEPLFELDNLEIVSGPTVSRSQRWINGRTSSSATLVWRLRARELGPAAVRRVRLRVGERVLELPDRAIEVVREPPPRARSGRPGPVDPFDALFGDRLAPLRRSRPAERPSIALAAELDRSTAWVGEQVVWSLVLETQTDISAFRPSSLPDFSGFWVRDLPLPDGMRPQWIERDGARTARVVQLRRALVPLRPGRLTIEATRADVVARFAEAGWLGPLGRDEILHLATRPLELEVRPLPPAPPSFSGLVGPVELAAALDPSRVAVGQATTLTVTAEGSGNLAALPPPSLALPAGLRAFAPATESVEEPVSGRLRNRVEWRYVLVADRAGRFDLPAVELGWFDPATSAFRLARTPPLGLEAAPAELASAEGGAVPPPSGAPPAAAPRSAWRLPAAYAGAAAAALALGAGLAVIGRGLWRRPGRTARRHLAATIAAARAEPSARRGAVLLEEAWRAFAAQRWQLTAGQPVAQWPDRLAAAGVAEPSVRALVELFDELHYLRYAPELSNLETLREEAVRRSLGLLRALG